MIENYLKEILKIKHDSTQSFPPLPSQIAELQAQLGFTEEDKIRLETVFQDFLARGKGFGKYAQWQKSITELTQATNLKPWDKEAVFLLADAHCHAFLQRGNIQDKKQAIYYANTSLKLDPNNELAIQIIDKVERKKVSFGQSLMQNVKIMPFLWIGLSFLAVYWLFFLENKPKEIQRNADKLSEVRMIDKTIYKKNNVPVSWTNGGIQGKWILEKSASQPTNNGNGHEYQLTGTWQSLETHNLTQIKAEISLFDDENKLLKQENWQVLNDSLSEMWKNDALCITHTWKNLKKAVKKVKIQLLEWEYEPENTQNTTQNIEIANTFIEFILECKERHQLIRPNAESFSHEIVFSIKNNSKIPMQSLKLKIQWLYKNNSLAHEQTFVAQNPYFPTWQVNEIRSYKQHFVVPIHLSDYKGYKIEVEEVE